MTNVYGEDEASSENRDKFSPCSKRNITKILDEVASGDGGVQDCFVDADFDEDFQPEIAICGNGIVRRTLLLSIIIKNMRLCAFVKKIDPGEECDCGLDPEDCNDSCCYPAHLSLDMRLGVADREAYSAQPCTRPRPGDRLFDCGRHTGLYFGVVYPAMFAALFAAAAAAVMFVDWRGSKKLFGHITQGDVRIVRPGQRQGQGQGASNA